MKRILVLTDYSPGSDRALAQAERLARGFGAELHLLHKVVYPPPPPPTELLDRLDDAAKFDYVLKEVIERPDREAKEALELRASRSRDRGFDVTTHLERSGEIYERAAAAIERLKPDLVVMGTHGRSGVQKWLMGSVAERILRHAPVDVVTLHEGSPVAGAADGIGEIVVPTDFSDGSRRALETAFRWSETLSGTICLLHVIEPRFFPGAFEMAPTFAEVGAEMRARFEHALIEELSGRQGSVLLAEGHVAGEIDRVARERGAGMIALGTRGRGGLRHAVLGSVAERVARISRLPVLTVR